MTPSFTPTACAPACLDESTPATYDDPALTLRVKATLIKALGAA